MAATLAFSASAGLPMFLLWWMVNRFVQSAGWAGLTKTAAHWYPARRYGTVMSFLSLSFLFGDAAGRYLLGGLLMGGSTWREVFVAAAGILGVIGVVVAFMLRGSPREVGLPESAVNADNIFGESGGDRAPQGLSDLVRPYFASPSFWLVCGLSFGMTLIREAFNTWIPVYLSDAHHLAQGTAAQYSAVFPLLGGVSSIVVGVVTDRLRSGNRVALMVPAMALCTLALMGLAIATARQDLTLSLLAIGGTAFCLLGPDTLLAGAIAMDMGGRKGSATAAGLIDTAGYAGGTAVGICHRRVGRNGWLGARVQRDGGAGSRRWRDRRRLLRSTSTPHSLARARAARDCARDIVIEIDRNQLADHVLEYLRTFIDVSHLEIAERWHGTYVKHPTEPYCVLTPEDGVTAVAALGGHGMTLSFGLAEHVVRQVLG